MQIKTGNNNYSLSILLTLVGGVGLAIALLLLHYFPLPEVGAQWLFGLIVTFQTFGLIGGLISGNGYLSQLIDRLSKETTLWNRYRHRSYDGTVKERIKAEISTFTGLSLGILAGIGVICFSVIKHIPVVNSFASVASMIAGGIRIISTYGGLGNRIGTMIDNFKRGGLKLKAQQRGYTAGILAGLGIGIALSVLILLHPVALALPPLLFCLVAISTSASAMGYLGRVTDFVTEAISLKSIKKAVTHERALTVAGVIVGLTLGVILVAAGVATLPFFGLGAFKLTAGVMLIGACVSAFGGLGNRLGFFLDRCRPKPVPAPAKANDDVLDQAFQPSSKKSNRRSSQADITETLAQQNEHTIERTEQPQRQVSVGYVEPTASLTAVSNFRPAPAVTNDEQFASEQKHTLTQ